MHFSILLHLVRYVKSLLLLENNRSSYSWVSSKSERKDARSLLLFYFFVLFYLQKMYFSGKKFDVRQLKINKIVFNVNQLKIKKFIKSIGKLNTTTSNAILEVPSLLPWACNTIF